MGSYENIVGAPFEDWVVEQLKLRSKFNGDEQRNSSNINAVSNNGCWIRVTSNVLQKNNNTPSKLANQWILQGGTLSQDGLKYGIKDNALYSHGEIGFRPMPGIESATIESAGVAGSLRTANIKIKAWDVDQLDKLDTLYLRLGWSVFIEWGHSVYYDNKGNKQNGSPLENYDTLKTDDEILKEVYKKKKQTNGNYDAMFGIISNYTWTQNESLGYDIDLKVVGMGQVIDSLMINKSLDGKGSVKTPSEIQANNADPNLQTLFSYLQTIPSEVERVCDGAGTQVNLNLDYFKPIPLPEHFIIDTHRLGQVPMKIVLLKGEEVTNVSQKLNDFILYREGIKESKDIFFSLDSINYQFVSSLRSAIGIHKRVTGLEEDLNKERKAAVEKVLVEDLNNVLSFFNLPNVTSTKDEIDTSSSTVLKYFIEYILNPIEPKVPEDILYQTISYFTTKGTTTLNIGGKIRCSNNIKELSVFDDKNKKVNQIKFELIGTEDSPLNFLFYIKSNNIPGRDNISIIVATDTNIVDKSLTNSRNSRIIYSNNDARPSSRIQNFINQWYNDSITALPSGSNSNQLSFEVKNDDKNSISAIVIPKALTGETGVASTDILNTVNIVRVQLQSSDKYKDLEINLEGRSSYNTSIRHSSIMFPPAQNETNTATTTDPPPINDPKEYKSELEQFLIEVREFTNGKPDGLVDGYQPFLSSQFEKTEGPLSQIFKNDFNGPELFGYNSRNIHDPNSNLRKINTDLVSRIYKFSWDVDTTIQSYSYISLGALIAYLNHKCLLYYNNQNDKNKKIHPYVKIDFNNETNFCLTSPLQISLDPRICLVAGNKSLNQTFTQLISSVILEGEVPSEISNQLSELNINNSSLLRELEGSGFRDSNPYVGRMMLIYLNIDNLLEIIRNLQTTNNAGNVYLRPFLEQILDQVNAAMGSINKFRVSYYDEGNTVRIIDDQTLNKPETISIQKLSSNEGSKSFTPFPNENVGKNSVVKKFTFKTEISNKLHTIIAVSAQAGNYGQITDASGFGLVQVGLTDRILENKVLTSTDTKNLDTEVGFFLKQVNNIYSGIVNTPGKRIFSMQDLPATNQIYSSLLNKNKSENKAIKGKDIIPLSLNITLHGISGILVLQSFTLPPKRMPSQYYYLPGGTIPRIGWVISRQSHTISSNMWETTLTGLMILIPEKSISDVIDPIKDTVVSYPAEILPESTWSENYLWDGGRRITPQPVTILPIDSARVAQPYEPVLKILLNAAKKDNVIIKVESGYRTFQDQINVRRKNSNGNNYTKEDLLFKLPTAFSPVSGLPGHSDHQAGTAFDFILGSRDSVEYKWLDKNGEKYGFKNTVASEPWHWSYVKSLNDAIIAGLI